MITLKDAIANCKETYFVKLVINNKFTLFNCQKEKMFDKYEYEYLEGFENMLVDVKIDYTHRGYKTYCIYAFDIAFEKRCLYLENLWYDKNNNFLTKREVGIWR